MKIGYENPVAYPALTAPVAAAGSSPELQSQTAVRDRNAPRAGGGSLSEEVWR